MPQAYHSARAYLLVLKDASCGGEIFRFTPGTRADIYAVNLGVPAVLRQRLVVWGMGLGHDRFQLRKVVSLL